MKSLLRVCVLLALVATALGAGRAQAAPGERCFAETGFCISGTIRTYWEQNGGLPVFGYPISTQHTETIEGTWTGPTQWFERDRLEDHSNEGAGVLAGRLGDQYLLGQNIDWHQLPGDSVRMTGCRFFPETSHNLCGPFLHYWEQNGGLARFGYPITAQRDEAIEGKTYQVQYFERRRMEYHPENAGTPYDVLLGLLGRTVYTAPTAQAPCPLTVPSDLVRTIAQYRTEFGCPTIARSPALALQRFEHGAMIWEAGTSKYGGTITVLTYDMAQSVTTWASYPDTYVEGEADGAAPQAPAGQYVPTRGFGKLWRADASIRNGLGFAIEREQGDSGDVLYFNDGKIIHPRSSTQAYILHPNRTVETTNVR